MKYTFVGSVFRFGMQKSARLCASCIALSEIRGQSSFWLTRIAVKLAANCDFGFAKSFAHAKQRVKRSMPWRDYTLIAERSAKWFKPLAVAAEQPEPPGQAARAALAKATAHD